MSKDRTLLERFSTTIQLLKNEIDKIEQAKKLFATASTVHDILKAANLEECCDFVKTTEDRSLARRELKASLKGLYKNKSTLLRHKLDDCRNFEERSDQIDEIIQARKLLKYIDQHDFKDALKIAGLSDIIKEATPRISRILENTFFDNLDKYLKVSRIFENAFFRNLDKYLEVKRKEFEVIQEAHQVECERGPSAPVLLLSTALGSSNCNNTYVTNNNHPADSAQLSVLPLNQHVYLQLSPDITTTAHTVHYPPKARKSAAPLPPLTSPSAPPAYTESDENNQDLLGKTIYHLD
ncbi:MAG: hypothetical protein DMENIID0002_13390 [Rickettsia endosymbiont of Sergentomyia squamirostris]|uniref:Uncharacterized protein n=1 Tax=Candidatus Tisiphia endosymbiont of Sergentomyia squamirostris TaxID=3113639 RepID=A0AAT9GA08_9RICK